MVLNGRKLLEQLTNYAKRSTMQFAGNNAYTSNLKTAMEPPKMEDAKCNQKRRETPDERRPPRNKYSLRLANMAAAEKQPKTTAQPTKAPSTMLQQEKLYIRKASIRFYNLTAVIYSVLKYKKCRNFSRLKHLK